MLREAERVLTEGNVRRILVHRGSDHPHDRRPPMPQPHDFTWTSGLHAIAQADERAWLDQWNRGLINPDTLESASPTAPFLVLAGAAR
jgi:hypothetical protein